ncbi:hypothetical protein [Aminobacter sp. AP02]|uniref:hypothetical protein n=1 Tax=Aminobacter sp. AP02 TaxID=2135737 RepID=UPI001FE22628|nr:hypothetical protein [Aminobacter sp. AP02]
MYEYKIHIKVVETKAQWLNIDMTTVSDVGLAPWLFNLYIDPKEEYPRRAPHERLPRLHGSRTQGSCCDVQEVSAQEHRAVGVCD